MRTVARRRSGSCCDADARARLDIASRATESVETRRPLARRRGYANVKFGVAGGSLELHGVPLEQARAIRGAILDSIASVDFSRLPV